MGDGTGGLVRGCLPGPGPGRGSGVGTGAGSSGPRAPARVRRVVRVEVPGAVLGATRASGVAVWGSGSSRRFPRRTKVAVGGGSWGWGRGGETSRLTLTSRGVGVGVGSGIVVTAAALPRVERGRDRRFGEVGGALGAGDTAGVVPGVEGRGGGAVVAVVAVAACRRVARRPEPGTSLSSSFTTADPRVGRVDFIFETALVVTVSV